MSSFYAELKPPLRQTDPNYGLIMSSLTDAIWQLGSQIVPETEILVRDPHSRLVLTAKVTGLKPGQTRIFRRPLRRDGFAVIDHTDGLTELIGPGDKNTLLYPGRDIGVIALNRGILNRSYTSFLVWNTTPDPERN